MQQVCGEQEHLPSYLQMRQLLQATLLAFAECNNGQGGAACPDDSPHTPIGSL